MDGALKLWFIQLVVQAEKAQQVSVVEGLQRVFQAVAWQAKLFLLLEVYLSQIC